MTWALIGGGLYLIGVGAVGHIATEASRSQDEYISWWWRGPFVVLFAGLWPVMISAFGIAAAVNRMTATAPAERTPGGPARPVTGRAGHRPHGG